MAGCVFSACTIAKPIRCVYDTLPPRARRRWLLITTRWSINSFTGSERTLVAVGTVSEKSMFFAVRAGAPRSTVLTGSSRSTVGRFAGFGGSAGTPPRLPGADGRAFLFDVGRSTVAGRLAADAAGASGAGWTGLLGAGAGGAVCFAGAAAAGAGCFAGAAGGAAGLGVCPAAPFPVEPLVVPPSWWVLKYCAQLGSTEPGSATYCSYISSSSQSLAPNSSARASVAVWVELDGSGTGATIAFFRRGLVGEGPSHREKRGPPASSV